MQLAWMPGENRSEVAEAGAGHQPWATLLAVVLVLALPAFRAVAGGAVWRHLVEMGGLRASTWGWDDPASYVRLLSYQFFHGSADHFFWNSLVLLLAGTVVERRNGTVATVAVLITGCIVAALAHLAWDPNETKVLIGASGTVSALLGMAFLTAGGVALPVRFPGLTCVYFRISLRFVIGLWFAQQVFVFIYRLVAASDAISVAYWSHLAGFATGVAVIALLRAHTSICAPPDPAPAHASLSAGD